MLCIMGANVKMITMHNGSVKAAEHASHAGEGSHGALALTTLSRFKFEEFFYLFHPLGTLHPLLAAMNEFDFYRADTLIRPARRNVGGDKYANIGTHNKRRLKQYIYAIIQWN